MNDKILMGRLVLPDRVMWGGLWIRGEKIVGVLAPEAMEAIHADRNCPVRPVLG